MILYIIIFFLFLVAKLGYQNNRKALLLRYRELIHDLQNSDLVLSKKLFPMDYQNN